MAPLRPDTLAAALTRAFEGAQDSRASWFALTRGERLFSAGDRADTLYLLRAGRLGVFRRDDGRVPQMIAVIKPGEPVGELAMLAGTSHMSDVVALRDSDVLALPREAFFDAARTDPLLMSELGQIMLTRARERGGGTEPNVFGFVSARDKPIRAFVERVARAVEAQGATCHVIDSSALSSAAEWFSRVEDAHDYVLYVAEANEPNWAALCARQVDRLFLVGAADRPPPPAPPVAEEWDDAGQRTDLILLRDPRMPRPSNTRAWLDVLKPGRWFHAVEGLFDDTARIARLITGSSVGVVLSGGGARAYAHIGALKALREAGTPIDFIGGASMGAVIGAGPALGWSDEELEHHIRQAFVLSDPLADIAPPIIAMTHARKVKALMKEAFGDVQMEDMLLPFFAVSTNLTAGKLEVHREGTLRHALRASISIPGVMPPVVMNGQVLVDGAVLRNFPSDVMRRLNSGPLVGVDVSQSRGVDARALENPPSWWRWILSGAWKHGPPIVSILMRAATLSSEAERIQARAETDLLILPPSDGVDIRDWKAYEPGVAAGYEAARAALDSLNGSVETLHRRRRADAPQETVEEMAEASFPQDVLETPGPTPGPGASGRRRGWLGLRKAR
ncbi:patatin-like phospholipase family protein [Brevundimonas naejangsanensis]|uniref:patatin-like phospholipase family protein n=1 Tax=Brevundimonas naejangsanensis TaxID=588932 RepID=UPI00106A0390|nr:patatin-like phospholipase family protein [Brevundimonas naejangsanensis]QBQ47619.1 cyclic nucleotide-binding domain-containing protein [Brevundimonas naejangsanensis]